MLDDLLNKARKDGGPMNEIIETMALLGQVEREVLKWYFREGPDETLDFGKHMGKMFREVYLEDPSYCSWTVRQDKTGAMKLRCFKYFARRMNALTRMNDGIRGKTNEVGKQLRDRVLEACCEGRAMEEERAKKKRVDRRRRERQGRKQRRHGREDQVGGCGR